MKTACASSVHSRAKPVQRCQDVSRSMPILRSSQGSRATSTSWKAMTRAPYRPVRATTLGRIAVGGAGGDWTVVTGRQLLDRVLGDRAWLAGAVDNLSYNLQVLIDVLAVSRAI